MVANAQPRGLRFSSLEEEAMHVTTVAAGGVDLVVRTWGAEDGEPILFWPALNPWGSLQLAEVGPLLAGRGFRVHSLAAPGTGETPLLADAVGYRPTRLAALALEAADALGLDPFAFMGASWGASVGVHLAVARPERVAALVLADGGYADMPLDRSLVELEQQVAADQERFAFESWDAYVEWARTHTARWSDALEARYRAGMRDAAGRVVPRADPRAAAWALHGLSAEPVSTVHARLGETGVPTLLLVPADADADAYERFRTLVPQAAIVPADAGHDVIQDQPAVVAETAAGWLR
jgi:pimeloyl-ACP methyl ester carboxylesterase